ncbi:LPXTG cell wall anchor domain-containing protein [Microbacterium sp. B2969]|uniref:LPXTG cell wall anchor domain-containing protein n=1 Tax=Microbacterium alkaliflavum TaxID=3248839 RepID=A0ABW7Q622_9MICO
MSAAIATTLVLGVPTAGYATEGSDPSPSPSPTGYTPTQLSNPTLAGSTAVGECNGDVPWISFTVTLVDPDNQSTSHTAHLVLTNGTETADIPLGELVDNHLSGRVLWPGASVDAAGNPTGWPGWAFENGKWVETDGNFRWTRGAITATLEVNPSLVVPLSYPPSTPNCATNPPVTPVGSTTSSTVLPVTGLGVAVLPISIAGALLAVAGIVLLLLRRRRRTHS